MSSAFKDHFSGHASSYRSARPVYPPALAEYVASLAPNHARVWDVGTGNGQLAELLANRFDVVFASDASRNQVEEARPHPKIVYAHEPAESPSLGPASVDAITVAQAAHWLDLERFYGAVRRVARPGAAIVLAGYERCAITPSIDPLVERFSSETVGIDWPPERALLDNRYRGLAFPFEEVQAPAIVMAHTWAREEFLAYVGSWSSVQRHKKRTGIDPMPPFATEVRTRWHDGVEHEIRWELCIRAGRVP